MANLLVTLLSDQTIPNVQFIKEKQNGESYFLFVSTSKMEEKGVGKWIQKVCNIAEGKTITKIVDEFSSFDIENKLKELDYSNYERVFVNITGGTKIMSIQVTDFFKKKENTDIYYITGNDCWHLFPESKRYSAPLKENIILKEYVESYGFEMPNSSLSGICFEYTKQFFEEFLKFGKSEHRVISCLREKRGKAVIINEIAGLQDFLCSINFPLSDKSFLKVSKNEVKYLTGEWFEEYIYYSLKEEKIVPDENLKTGIHLIKCTGKKIIDNEFDVIFLWKTKFYAIECKTSILSDMGKGNIINETIYKSTALQKNLGLFSNFSIFTLSSKEDAKKMHFDRAYDLNIKVFCLEDFQECRSIVELLKLPSC